MMNETVFPLEEYVLFADRNKSVSGLNKRMLFFLLPLVLLSFAFSHFLASGFSVTTHSKIPPYAAQQIQVPFSPGTKSILTLFPWLLVGECALLYLVMVRSYKKQKNPIITLSARGIEVDTSGTHLGLIYWNEIEEIRNYTCIYRFVGIVPKNTIALCQRLGMRRAWLVQMNAACIPLCKPFGLFVAPINIPQLHISLSADELLKHIQFYRAAYTEQCNLPPGLDLPSAEGVWPPPPQKREELR